MVEGYQTPKGHGREVHVAPLDHDEVAHYPGDPFFSLPRGSFLINKFSSITCAFIFLNFFPLLLYEIIVYASLSLIK